MEEAPKSAGNNGDIIGILPMSILVSSLVADTMK
jgi:hypothetical protein